MFCFTNMIFFPFFIIFEPHLRLKRLRFHLRKCLYRKFLNVSWRSSSSSCKNSIARFLILTSLSSLLPCLRLMLLSCSLQLEFICLCTWINEIGLYQWNLCRFCIRRRKRNSFSRDNDVMLKGIFITY